MIIVDKYLLIWIAVLYAFSFFSFGWVVRGWHEEDKDNVL